MRALIPCLFLVTACNGFLNNPPPPPPGSPILSLVGNFSSPVYLTAAPGDTQRLFVVEQSGRVRVLHHDTIQSRPFLDIRGLRYNVSSDPDSADEATADTILKVPHPGQSNHNGGQLQFGPDGMLFAGTGDGGGRGDPNGNALNKHALLGKLLRLDVSGASGYTMPADNPGATDTSFAPEVWSYGLRNPWRFSFDRLNGDLYIGDVGQDTYEEVDYELHHSAGKNYGWNIMEGLH